MNQLQLFLPCAAGVEDYLAPEALRITGLPPGCVTKQRGGVAVRTSFKDAMRLNLYCRLAQRVLQALAEFLAFMTIGHNGNLALRASTIS